MANKLLTCIGRKIGILVIEGLSIGKFSESVEEILQELKGQQGIHDGKEIMSFVMRRYPHETVFV